jgi:hypothetical protein
MGQFGAIVKLPYQYVSDQVDKLYEKEFPLSDLEGISQHCDFIRAFINACGWDEVDFIRVMMGFETESSVN